MRLANLLIAAVSISLIAVNAAGAFIPGKPATATVEFFDAGQVEAVLKLATVEIGERANGYTVTFIESSIPVPQVGVSFTDTSALVSIDAASIVPYQVILSALNFPPGLSATLASVQGDGFYNPVLQVVPVDAVLTGGIDPIIPEPSAGVLAILLGLALGHRPR